MCLFCKVWMSESVRIWWLRWVFLLSVWVRVLLIIGLLSVSSIYSPCNSLRPSHTHRWSQLRHFTWLQPLRHSSSNLMPTVSLPQLLDTLCLCCPVYLSISSCLNFPPVSSLSPVILHTPSPSLCRVPSPDIHKTSWHEISSNSSSVMWCVISAIHFNEIHFLN